MFYIIGLGLGDCKDITIKGLEIIRKCSKVYLESYTSILISSGLKELENFYGCTLITADRELVEQGVDDILTEAQNCDIAFLVVGDPFGATTHTDLILRAKEKEVKCEVVHNASILNAVGCSGLQLYNFGETVSIPYWTETWKPDSFFDKIISNFQRKLHTLCLLDIKVKEPTLESLTKKKKEYLPPKFMSVSEATEQILEVLKSRNSNVSDELNANSLSVGLARVGSETQKIVACSLSQMVTVDLGGPLHSLVIPGPELHPLEEEFLQQFKL
ncbi:diphthine methyl ester synthase [Agrilus planipennis]|uniref:diphthine methyl ester synthase n=1 Tax=Agrilus planipennis TaxID=224129 RepID=A0A1W4WYI7_AGRPL|nr:diphthine methyl ester synthase [Agrilus planipennis]